MPIFNMTEYIAIFPGILVVDSVAPFDCYVLLPLSQKLVLFFPQGKVISQERFERLVTHNHAQLFVKATSREQYYRCLDEFLSSQDGKVALQDSLRQGGKLQELGIPSESEFKLASLDSVGGLQGLMTFVLKQQEPEVKNVEIEKKESRVTDPAIVKVLDSLRNQTQNLEVEVKLHEQLNIDDRQVIFRAVSSIGEQLKNLDKLNPEMGDKEHQMIIKNITEKINEDIIHVKGLKNLSDEDSILVTGAVLEVQKEMATLKEKNAQIDIGQSKKRMQGHLRSLRGLASETHETMLTNALEQIIESVETQFGKSLNLMMNRDTAAEPSVSERSSPVGLIKYLKDIQQELVGNKISIDGVLARLNDLISKIESGELGAADIFVSQEAFSAKTISEEQLDGTNLADPRLVNNLKNLIGMQETTISNLTDKLKVIGADFIEMKTQLFTYQTLTKRKLDVADQMKGKQILQKVQDFESKFFSSINEERKTLKKITANFVSTLARNAVSGSSEGAEVDDLALPIGSSEGELADVNDSDEDLTKMANEAVQRVSEYEQVLAENKVLLVQMENAQALVDTTNKKVGELEELARSSGEYATALEDELGKVKVRNEELSNESQADQSEKRRLQEGLEDLNNSLFKIRSDSASEKEQADHLRQRISELESSLATYLEKFGAEGADLSTEVAADFSEAARALLMQKELEIKSLGSKLTAKIDENTLLKKQYDSATSDERKFGVERKDLGKRLEKQRGEMEALKQHIKSVDVKVTTTTNLLNNARKTINKLTGENEELRQDRTKYLRQTNEALANHKSLVGESLSLSNQVQGEMQKVKKLERDLELSSAKEKDLVKQVQRFQSQINGLETDKKKIESELKKQDQKGKLNESDSLKMHVQDLEKRIDLLKSENRELQVRFAQEQKKLVEFAQKAKRNAS
jgi:hypothetical protein